VKLGQFYIERFLRFVVIFISSKQGKLQGKLAWCKKINGSGVEIKDRRLCCGPLLAAVTLTKQKP
jgi:hypothetical protein